MAFNLYISSSYKELSEQVGEYIYSRVSRDLKVNSHFDLGLASGNSPKRAYQEFISFIKGRDLNLSNLHTFNLDEYFPIEKNSKGSFYTEMMQRFWKPLHHANKTFNIAHGHILDGSTTDPDAECARYEKLIKKRGWIDLQILGLGSNGHIAFNEPGSPIDSRTRKITITPESRVALAKTYDHIPAFGLTMGIGTILEAKEILLIVTGEGKKEVFKKLTSMTEPDPSLPASWLLDHPNVNIYTDILIQ
jgi:glucosamine-6-phosphate deaminase